MQELLENLRASAEANLGKLLRKLVGDRLEDAQGRGPGSRARSSQPRPFDATRRLITNMLQVRATARSRAARSMRAQAAQRRPLQGG